MEKGVVCANCGKITEKICSYCWKCKKCCDCGRFGAVKEDSKKRKGRGYGLS